MALDPDTHRFKLSVLLLLSFLLWCFLFACLLAFKFSWEYRMAEYTHSHTQLIDKVVLLEGVH